MEAVIAWQILVAGSIAVARFFSSRAMVGAAVCWSVFSILALWTHWLLFAQLFTAWCTVWCISWLVAPTAVTEKDIQSASRDLTKKQAAETSSSATPLGENELVDRVNLPLEVFSETIESFARVIEDRVEEVSDYIEGQKLRIQSNNEFKDEISNLVFSTDSSVESGQIRVELAHRIAQDPHFAENYRRIATLLRGPAAQQAARPLLGLSLFPVTPESIPPQAVKERIGLLEEAMVLIDRTRLRIAREPALLSAINSRTLVPFEQFLTEQHVLLRAHLSWLQPPVSVGNDATIDLADFLSRELSAEFLPEAENLEPAERSKIQSIVVELGIPHLVHFTQCANLPTILRHGLVSVTECEKSNLTPLRNDLHRWDRQLDGISVSIAFPNYLMFYKYRRSAPNNSWAVLLISPNVLWEKDCSFHRHNAADSRMTKQSYPDAKRVRSLLDMFSVDNRESFLRTYDPTDPQAEVMVHETIDPRSIEAIAFETAEARASHKHLLGGLDSFFAGAGRGLFGSRKRLRMGL